MLALTRQLLDALEQPACPADPKPPRRTSAIRQRRARERARHGLRIFRLEAEHDLVVLALIESRRISETDALEHAKDRGRARQTPARLDVARLSARSSRASTATFRCARPQWRRSSKVWRRE